MARAFRFWIKKRGDRQTGNPRIGNLGEAVFFGVLFLLGTISLAALITNYAMDPRPEITTLGFGFWLLLMVLSTFVLIGGGGLIYTVLNVRTSAERRSAMRQRASQIELIREAGSSPRDYPNVPRDTNLTNSPGVRLKYRLPVSQSSAWTLLIAALFALIWNGITSSLAVVAIGELFRGQGDGFLLMFTLPFLAVGAWAIVRFIKLMSVYTRFGPTILEVSDLPLMPGGEYQVFLSQAGQLTIRRLRMSLICEEEATFRQGTDVRTETRRVWSQTLLRRNDLRVTPAAAFEETISFRIPRDAMHSFESFHNAIRWKLVVRAKASGRPVMRRWFPVIVFPARAGNETTTADRTVHAIAGKPHASQAAKDVPTEGRSDGTTH